MPCAMTSFVSCATTALSQSSDETSTNGRLLPPCKDKTKKQKIRFMEEELGLTSEHEILSFKQEAKERAMMNGIDTLSYPSPVRTPPPLDNDVDDEDLSFDSTLLTPPSTKTGAGVRLPPSDYKTYLTPSSPASADLALSSEIEDIPSASISNRSPNTTPKSILRASPALTPVDKPSSSCSGIWLCSAPRKPQSQTQSSISRTDSSTSIICLSIDSPLPPASSSSSSIGGATGSRSTSCPITTQRPLIVRSHSTGRLAFDSEGRVRCLSSHSSVGKKPPSRLSTMGRARDSKSSTCHIERSPSRSRSQTMTEQVSEKKECGDPESEERSAVLMGRNRSGSPSPSVKSDSAVDLNMEKKRSLASWAKKGWKGSGLRGVIA
ncbi:hypothetical protein IAR55_006208 [Kwoniella newhampshirensis]|uniref:Uncharacterized protein n=1 Tax=Kwoniella newhampshirensis TaxID=1651941 RepID=A0AAW0YUX4_9TREE